MDWQALRQIVVLLIALADLAERAGARPQPIPCRVLCILRLAEAVARQFAVELSGSSAALPTPAFDDPALVVADERAEAMRLAVAFRLLAFVVHSFAAAGSAPCRMAPCRMAPCPLAPPHRDQGRPVLAAHPALARLASQGFDTS